MGKINTRQVFKTGFTNSDKMILLDDEELDCLKKILLEMLEDIRKVLDSHSLCYTLSGGSVLGAVRHKGFIPWDDDIDINMPRQDYQKLLDIFDRELGEKYLLCSPERTHNHGMLNAQIKKKGTKYRSFNELSKEDKDCGICIDIFVIENTFNNPILRKIHGAVCMGAGYISTCRKTYVDMPYLEEYLEKGSAADKAFRKKARIGRFFSWLSLDRVTRMARNCYALCRNNQSDYVTIPSGRGHFFKEMHARRVLCKTKKAVFEHMTVYIPYGSEAYLTALYGADYMKLPPADKREQHPLMEFDAGVNKEL